MELKIKIINENARGLYSTDQSDKDDSGLDLYTLEDIKINIGETVYIDLGIQCEMKSSIGNNTGYYLYPRSSISKTPLIMANSVGIIDSGYRGNIKAAVKYIPDQGFFEKIKDNQQPIHFPEYIIKKNTRLFQICTSTLEPFTTQIVNELSSSNRGEGGFGSTGAGIKYVNKNLNIISEKN